MHCRKEGTQVSCCKMTSGNPPLKNFFTTVQKHLFGRRFEDIFNSMADYVLIMFMIHTITIKLQLFDIVYRVIKVK